ncbi:MAG: hypothetical protein ABI383_05535 [Acidobacteriaceae bacterium]
MSYSQITEEPLFTEVEAAKRLGVSLPRLHRVLDENLFSSGEARPAVCVFRRSDLVLLAFWLHITLGPRILRMPRRN